MNLLKKLPVPAALFAALMASIVGPPVGATAMDSIVHRLNEWAAANIRYPLLAVFFAALLFAYGIYQILIFGIAQRRQRARIQLAKLRIAGTALRREGMNLSNTLALDRWVGKTGNWVDHVSKEISKIDKADALQFGHLGYPGNLDLIPEST